jgi:hypothetical protein
VAGRHRARDGGRPARPDLRAVGRLPLVPDRGLAFPGRLRHADAGLDNQLAFLDAALDYVARHTPRDGETLYLEAVVTARHNTDEPETIVLRSVDRDLGTEQ